MTRPALLLLLFLLLPGCAISPQCYVGFALVGPIPVPSIGCDLYAEPEDDDEDDE